MDNPGTIAVLAVRMTRSTDSLDLLTMELERRSCSPSGRRALRRLAAAGVGIDGVSALTDVVTRIHRLGHTADPEARTMLGRLLELAPSDEDAALCALVALRPSLRWVASRVYGTAASDDEIAELVAVAWGAICDGRPTSGSRERYIVLATRTRARAAKRQRERSVPGLRAKGPPRSSDPAQRPEPLLAAAVDAGVLRRPDAELIALTRAAGVPISILAREHGCTDKALLRRRQRAERALRGWLRSGRRA